ncbi:MAG: ATP-binding protein [Cyanobacteria bacterium J06597_1]
MTTISSVLLGVLFSAAFGVTAGVTFGMALSVAVGLGFGVIAVIDGAVGEATSIATRVAVGVVFGVVFGVMRGVVRSGPTGFVVVAMAGFGGGLSLGFGGGLAFGTCLFLHTWSPVALFPLLILGGGCLQFLDGQVGTDSPYYFLRWHPAFWYEWQRLHWPGLAKHVLMVYERNQAEGQAALYYLSTSRQRWAAQAVQLELDARKLENFQTIQALSKTEEPNTALDSDNPGVAILRRFEAIGQDTSAALAQTSNYNQRLAFKDISDKLNSLVMELTRTDNKAAPRFRPIAQQWQTIVTQYCNQLAQTAEQNQDLDNPYITGVPLTQSQYIFVGRTDTCARIEQLLLDDRRPPLFLYGQRRTGKTSLLNNLGRLLPTRFIPTSVDLQGPTSKARDASGFLYNLAREISKTALYQRNLQLPKLSREALAADPFTTFDEWLDDVEQILDDKVGNGTLLLTLDEFEALDEALVKERFNEQDILGTLRNIIQHRPRIKVMIAGSHTLQEFHRWASYLINVQVIHLSYLKESEARQLIEHPTPDFALRYEPDAVQRILDLTRCQPYLVQLLCAELVAHKNDQDPSIRRLALRVDVEAVIEPAIDSGSFFFADIQNNQVDATGLAVLRSIAAGEWVGVSREKLEQQFEDGLSAAISQLQQRELIEPTGNGYKFQVEMIRRWFAREMTP